jgi:hypothetical protein
VSLNPGKLIEAAVRRMRPWLMPEYRRAFAALAARGLKERRQGEPIVCCDFGNPAIDAVGGRYYFSLVRDLIDAGYFPVFTARRATLSTFGTSRMKSLLLSERLGVVRSLDELKQPYFLITDDASAAPEHAERTVMVDYEWRICKSADEIAFPFFVHPWIASSSPPKLAETRTARLFFGGNTEQGKYDKPVIREVYGMLSRRDMLEAAAAAIPASGIFKPTDAVPWLESQEFHPYVFCETQRCKIPPERWLEALSKADFFLACPGVGMPLCHNVIEAMTAGCIPILQYSAYLSPPLQHGVNCLAFDDAQSLNAVLHSIFSMSDAEITALRSNVRAHYEAHLAPGRFTERLLDGTGNQRTLLLNSYRVPLPS